MCIRDSSRAFSLTKRVPLTTCETVVTDTLARKATSLILAILRYLPLRDIEYYSTNPKNGAANKDFFKPLSKIIEAVTTPASAAHSLHVVQKHAYAQSYFPPMISRENSATSSRFAQTIGIKHNGKNNYATGNHLSDEIAHPNQNQPVGQHTDNARTQERADDRSTAA